MTQKVETWIFSSHITFPSSSELLGSHEFKGTQKEAFAYLRERIDETFSPFVVWQFECKETRAATVDGADDGR